MNGIITLTFACILAASVSCHSAAGDSPTAEPPGVGTSKAASSVHKKVAFHVLGLMKTKSGAT